MEADGRRAAPIIRAAQAAGASTLSEHESKQVLAAYGIPVTREVIIEERAEVAAAAAAIGYPLAIKACSSDIPHKTERGLIRLDVRGEAEALEAFDHITAGLAGLAGGVLLAEMIPGGRELAAGLVRDADFGPCVMFGLGGIFTEVLHDVTFGRAPLDQADALAMLEDIRGHRILDEVRGMPAADRPALAGLLVALGRIGLEHPAVREIDLNPLLLAGARPVVADALIVLR